jgi:hypothetical protein
MTSKQSIINDLASDMEIERLFQKHVIDGTSYFFRDFLSQIDQEYELRHDIASALDLSINDVVIVGSAKLGFSVKNAQFEKFDGKYEKKRINRNKSDIDIAIANKRLFDEQTALIFELSRHFSPAWIEEKWKTNAYYQEGLKGRDPLSSSLYINYARYITRGWLRPDYTPNLYINQIPWKNATNIWTGKLHRKISIGLYSDWHYLKHYQMDNLINLRAKAKALEIPHD